MNFNDLKILSEDELKSFRDIAIDWLYKLQSSGDTKRIEFWSELEARCSALLKDCSNG